MANRIRTVRKNAKLSQEAFGERLGVSRDVIKNLENDRVELKDYMAKLISQTFGVSERWLITGDGPMHDPETVDPLELLADKYNLSGDAKLLIQRFAELDPKYQTGVIEYAKSIAPSFAAKAEHAPARTPAQMTREELRAEFERQMDLQEEAAAKRLA